AGGEFQFEQSRQVQTVNAVDVHAHRSRIGKGDGFGFAVARKVAGHQELNAHPIFRVAQLLAAGERHDVAAALQTLVNLSQTLARDKEIDILREAAVAVQKHRHAADNHV